MNTILKVLLLVGCGLAVAEGQTQNSTNALGSIEEVLNKSEKVLIYGDRYSGGLNRPGKEDAITVLGFIGGERAATILLNYAENEDNNNMRHNLIRSLGWIGSPKAVPFLEKMVKDTSNMHATRSLAAKALQRITGKEYEAEKTEKDLEFEKGLYERMRRRSGISGKPQSSAEKPPNASEVVQRVLGNNPKDKSREMYKGKSIDEWIEVLKGGKGEGRRDAVMFVNAHLRIKALAGTPDPRARIVVPELIRILQNENEERPVRSLALLALEGMGPAAADAVPVLIELLPKNTPAVMKTLGGIGPAAQAAVPVLIKIFEGNDSLVVDAAEALWRINKYPQAIPAIYAALQDENVALRRTAAIALERLGTDAKAAAPALVSALRDKEPMVRVFAANALRQTSRDPRAITAMAELLQVKEGMWSSQAAIFLERIGPDAKAAVPALVESLQLKGVANMPSSAARALKAIDLEAAGKAGVK